MEIAKNIYLVGPMGTGKTTIGKQLAKKLEIEFYDSDHEIEEKTGVDIARIFDVEGEAGFRERERKVIAELTELEGIVMATGGGAILDEQNRVHLAENGFVVYLKSSVDHLLERTRHDTKRPLLQTANPREKLEELVATRDPLYESIADCIIETGGRSIRGVSRKITNKILATMFSQLVGKMQ
jgi:shikimate kinase